MEGTGRDGRGPGHRSGGSGGFDRLGWVLRGQGLLSEARATNMEQSLQGGGVDKFTGARGHHRVLRKRASKRTATGSGTQQ